MLLLYPIPAGWKSIYTYVNSCCYGSAGDDETQKKPVWKRLSWTSVDGECKHVVATRYGRVATSSDWRDTDCVIHRTTDAKYLELSILLVLLANQLVFQSH